MLRKPELSTGPINYILYNRTHSRLGFIAIVLRRAETGLNNYSCHHADYRAQTLL